MFISFELIIIVLGIISVPIIFMLNRPKKAKKIEIVKDEIVLFDDEIQEIIQETFKDNIQYDYSEIELIDDSTIQDLKENIKNRIHYDFEEIELIDESTIQDLKENINKQIKIDINYLELEELGKDISTNLKSYVQDSITSMIDSYKKSFNDETNKDKLNNKTIYEVIPDRYLDLMEKDIDNCVYANETIKYIGSNLKIVFYTQNPNEYWYIEVQKDNKEKYGLSLSQKKRVLNITAFIKYSLGLELNRNELSSFNYIKKRVKNACQSKVG